MAKEKVSLTQEGYDKYEAEYRFLIDVERPRVIAKIANAREMGDLSENADYTAAKDEQGVIESRIKVIEDILNNAIIVKSEANSKVVGIASTVKFLDLSDNTECTATIVSSLEADPITDPLNIKISTESPLGTALMNHKVGETVTVKAIKNYNVKILEILHK